MSHPILIIGAGLAGLAAAASLKEKGFEVRILEARDRCGGRVWSDSSWGFPLDRGAAWIHGNEGNPITALAQQFKVSLSPIDFSRFYVFDRQGYRISSPVIQEFEQAFKKDLALAKEFAFQAPQDLSLASALSPFFKFKALSAVQQDLFKRRRGFLEQYMGAGYEQLSARYWDQELRLPGNDCIPLGSYAPIIQGLTSYCSVQFNTVVQVIREHPQQIEVITTQGNYQATIVLITVPLSILQNNSIHFDPPLPARKQNALTRLGMGLFNIAALKFPHLFWEADSQAFFFSEFEASAISTFINFFPLSHQPILIGYSGGDKALRLESLSDQAQLAKLMTHLRQHYGQGIPEPDAYFFTRWSKDPFSKGSYSYLPVGASHLDREVLAEPLSSRIFFAGEATHRDFPASTHGAYWSGLREAERIAEVLR